MTVSLWIAVQSLAASWNQTLNNATGSWSGELLLVKLGIFKTLKPAFVLPILLSSLVGPAA